MKRRPVDVSPEIETGHFLSFIGLSGSGRLTLLSIVALATISLLGLVATRAMSAQSGSEQCADEDRVDYEALDPRSLKQVKLERLSFEQASARVPAGGVRASLPHGTSIAPPTDCLTWTPQGEAVLSPHGTGRLVVDSADMTRDGPWNTTVYIATKSPNPSGLKLQFIDHGNGGVRANWLNDKLVFLQVWWGRVRSDDLIVDVQRGTWVYAEAANYLEVTLPRCHEDGGSEHR